MILTSSGLSLHGIEGVLITPPTVEESDTLMLPLYPSYRALEVICFCLSLLVSGATL